MHSISYIALTLLCACGAITPRHEPACDLIESRSFLESFLLADAASLKSKNVWDSCIVRYPYFVTRYGAALSGKLHVFNDSATFELSQELRVFHHRGMLTYGYIDLVGRLRSKLGPAKEEIVRDSGNFRRTAYWGSSAFPRLRYLAITVTDWKLIVEGSFDL